MFPVKYLWSDKLTISPKKGTWIVCSLFQICIPQTFCRCLVIQYPVGICSERRNEKQVKGWGTVARGEGKWHAENIYILSWNNIESQQNRQAHFGCISLKKRQRITDCYSTWDNLSLARQGACFCIILSNADNWAHSQLDCSSATTLWVLGVKML